MPRKRFATRSDESGLWLKGADLSAIEEFVSGEGRWLEVAAEIELKFMFMLMVVVNKRRRRRNIIVDEGGDSGGACGSAEEEVAEALRA